MNRGRMSPWIASYSAVSRVARSMSLLRAAVTIWTRTERAWSGSGMGLLILVKPRARIILTVGVPRVLLVEGFVVVGPVGTLGLAGIDVHPLSFVLIPNESAPTGGARREVATAPAHSQSCPCYG